MSAFSSDGAFYFVAEHIPWSPKALALSRGGLEDTDNLEATINEFTFAPLNLPSKVPTRKEVIEYVVQEGDTLGGIADSYGVKLSTLLWANNLTERSAIRPGQKIAILPIDGVLHKVKSGETLSSLSLTYQVYTEEIMEVNDISSDGFIVAGQTLIIPGAKPLPPPTKRIVSREPIVADVRGSLVMPAPGARRSQGLHWRNAVDLANSCGSPVVAAASGTIARADGAGWNGGFGKYIMIQHAGGFVTVYGHLSQIFVAPGEAVGRGERIGSIGATGHATGCHVHFEVRGGVNPFVS